MGRAIHLLDTLGCVRVGLPMVVDQATRFGQDLPEADKNALIAFLATL